MPKKRKQAPSPACGVARDGGFYKITLCVGRDVVDALTARAKKEGQVVPNVVLDVLEREVLPRAQNATPVRDLN